MSTEGSIGNDFAEPSSGIIPGELERKLKNDAAAVVGTAREDAVAVGDEIGNELQHLKEQAGEQINELRQQAEQQISATVEKAKGFAGEQKDVIAKQLLGVADALGKVAGELDGTEQAAIGRYARDISSSVRRFAETVDQNDIDQLLGKIEQFGRGQQLAFLGIAGLAGLAASRFLMASAQRRSSPTQYDAAPDDIGSTRSTDAPTSPLPYDRSGFVSAGQPRSNGYSGGQE